MKNKILAAVIIGLVLVLTGCQTPPIKSLRDETTPAATASPVITSLVTIQNNQFNPPLAEVAVGQIITFQNLDSTAHQIASDPHPSHSILPDLFSPQLYKNQTWSYTFKSAGQFGVHLEDNPSVLGKIIVRE